jgi:hypothetical protein
MRPGLVKESVTQLSRRVVQQTRRSASIGGWNQKADVKLAIASRDQTTFCIFFCDWHSRCLDDVIPMRG